MCQWSGPADAGSNVTRSPHSASHERTCKSRRRRIASIVLRERFMIRRTLYESVRAYFLGRDIFVSYSYKDSRYAEPLAVALRDAGISVFLGAWGASPGREFSRAVKHALLDCGILVVVATPEARDSANVAGEIEYFADGRAVIAIDLRGWMSNPAVDFPALSGIDVISERKLDENDPKPSAPVLARIKNAETSVRQEIRLRRFLARVFVGTVAILTIAAALGGLMIWSAKSSERDAADAANQSRIESRRAKREAVAEQAKAAAAVEAQNAAYSERDKAKGERDQAQTETARQQEIADALDQANGAAMLLQQEPVRMGHASLLAVDAVRRLAAHGIQGLAADAAIRQAFALLPDVKHTTRFEQPIRGQTAITSDRRFVAAAVGEGDIDVWDITDSSRTRLRAVVPRLQGLHQIAISDDGSRVAANFGTHDAISRTFIWHRSDGALLAAYDENPCAHTLALTPDGGHIATGTICDQTLVTVRDVRTQRIEHVLDLGSPRRIDRLAFSPAGKYLAVAADQALIWEWQSATEAISIPGDRVYQGFQVEFNPKDESIVAVANEGGVAVWRWPDCARPGAAPVRRYPTPYMSTREMPAFSPSGEIVAFNSISAHTARWQKSELTRGVPMPRDSFRLAVDDFSRVAATHYDRSTAIYNAVTGKELGRCADDGEPVAIGIGSDFRVRSISTTGARIWSPVDTTPLISRSASSLNGIAIDSAGSTFVVTEGSAELGAYRDQARDQWTLAVAGAQFVAAALAPDGHLFAGTNDGRLYSWPRAGAAAGDRKGELWRNIGGPISTIAVHRDRRVAFTTGQLIHDLDRRTGVTYVYSHPARVSALAYLRDGTLIVGGEDGRLLFWRGRMEVPVAPRFRHGGAIRSIAVSSDGRLIGVAGNSRIAEVIDTGAAGARIVKVGHTRAASSIAFSSTGEYLITGGEDGVARVWRDWRTLPLEVSRFLFRSDVNLVRFTPEDRYVLAGTWVEGIQRFLWDPRRLVTEVCRRLAPFVEKGDEPQYREVCGGAPAF
jgi:WD40 repeat protein